MSIEIANESGCEVDEAALAALARHVLDEMSVHPLAELSVLLVDEPAMAELHVRWMGETGPTDVLAFPMDELRPPHLDGNRSDPGPDPGLLGDVVLCPQVAAADSLYVTEDYLLTHNTLNDAFIILDEAQNTSAEQMKMFLTRLGFGSKIVVTGDVTQVDLPNGTESGLRVVQQILEGLDDIHFSRLTSVDVVRHRLVGEIVEAYGRFDAVRQAQQQAVNGQAGPRGRGSGRQAG